jgi:hypothetical protein
MELWLFPLTTSTRTSRMKAAVSTCVRFGPAKAICRIDQQRDLRSARHQFAHQLKALRGHFDSEEGDAIQIAARTVEARHKDNLDRVGADHKNNRDR